MREDAFTDRDDHAVATATIPVSELILVSEDRASRLLGVSKPTLRLWASSGLISPVALPGGMRRRLYRRVELEEFAARLADSASA